MKSLYTIILIPMALTMLCGTPFSQAADKSFKKSEEMTQKKNKEVIHFLYDSIFNLKNFDELSKVISPGYTNQLGDNGVEGFKKTIIVLANAFPDAHWKITDIVSEGDKVIVKQKFTGIHTAQFQNIKPTNKTVTVDGIATYEFENGKIICSQIQTDRFGFMQQLGVLPNDLTTVTIKNGSTNGIYFIDKFFAPKASIGELKKQMNYNRNFIKTLSGYVSGEVFEQYDNDGNLTIITIAQWESQDKLNEAKVVVQNEFKRIGFNPSDFYERLKIKLERGQYTNIKE